jgi:hypothetical protein
MDPAPGAQIKHLDGLEVKNQEAKLRLVMCGSPPIWRTGQPIPEAVQISQI